MPEEFRLLISHDKDERRRFSSGLFFEPGKMSGHYDVDMQNVTNEDLIIRRHILNLMCAFETRWETEDTYFNQLPDVLIQLKELEEDGLVELYAERLIVTTKGKPFVRNICMAFDLRLQERMPESKLFSMTI